MRGILLLAIILAGCTSTKKDNGLTFGKKVITTYDHPTYGKVISDDTRMLKDKKACEEKVYKDGVLIDGKMVYGRKELNNILSRYKSKYLVKNIKDYRSVPEESEIQNIANNYVKNEPAYMSEIRSKQKQMGKCFRVDKGYKLIKTDFINPTTGLIVETIEH